MGKVSELPRMSDGVSMDEIDLNPFSCTGENANVNWIVAKLRREN